MEKILVRPLHHSFAFTAGLDAGYCARRRRRRRKKEEELLKNKRDGIWQQNNIFFGLNPVSRGDNEPLVRLG